MATPVDRPIEVRAATRDDHGAVMELLASTLGWAADDRFDSFFRWKHEDNPFGPSPAWVATDGDAVVGFRTFLRWEYEDQSGSIHRAVRAVDTATRPSHQGRGIFRSLTLRALDDLRSGGTSFVFNTPNDQSRPGYLQMGWQPVGHIRTAVRVTSWTAPMRMARSRVPAARWSTPSSFGHDAREVLADREVNDVLNALEPAAGLRTRRTLAYLQWRYGFESLAYRALTVSDSLADGFAIFRLRQRGAAIECALCDVMVPAGHQRAGRRLVRDVARGSGADYVIRVGREALDRSGFVRAAGQGPVLTWLPLVGGAPGRRESDWDLALGDVELF